MFKSISDYIYLLIPVAIVIGRIVSGARRKKAPPPERKIPQPYIPVHFEDDDNDSDYYDEPGYLKESDSKSEKAKPEPQKTFAVPLFTTETAFSPLEHSTAVKKIPLARETIVDSRRQKEFAFNLNHLSPMQQAVVMAEILGQPKGMKP
jgi:hypothetical protein